MEEGVWTKFKRVSKKTWAFLKEDSWKSLIVNLILAFLIIKFILFPVLSLLTGTALPLVIVESCSMYHSTNLSDVINNQIYSNYGISLNDTQDWKFKSGINKGDVIFVLAPKNLKVGDVIVFNGGAANPIIHRIILIENGKITTKGDHNSGLLAQEQGILQEQIIGKAAGRMPSIGWAKLIFYDVRKPQGERGLCV
jgi:signal peptidase I